LQIVNEETEQDELCRNAATGAFCPQLDTPDSSSSFAMLLLSPVDIQYVSKHL